MVASGNKLKTASEEYLAELCRIRATGSGTGELSYYPPLNNLLNAVRGSLRPRVHCVSQIGPAGSRTSRFRSLRRQAGVGGPESPMAAWWRSSPPVTTPG